MESTHVNRHPDFELGLGRVGFGSRTRRLWEADREIERILSGSCSLEETRDELYSYLDRLDRKQRGRDRLADELDLAKAREAIDVFRNLLSPANEARVGFSTLELMRQMVFEQGDDAAELIGEGFTEEIHHLLLAIHGKIKAF